MSIKKWIVTIIAMVLVMSAVAFAIVYPRMDKNIYGQYKNTTPGYTVLHNEYCGH